MHASLRKAIYDELLVSVFYRLGLLVVTVATLLGTLLPAYAASGDTVEEVLTDVPQYTVVVSELMWMGTDRSTADEWIELYNTEDVAVDISGWKITYLSKDEEKTMLTFDALSIQPHSYILIGNYTAVSEKSRLAVEPDIVSTKVSLPNTKLLLKLYDNHNRLIDEVDDGVGIPFAGSNASGTGSRASMERIDLFGSGTDKENWQTAQISSGFDTADGVVMHGTPGRELSLAPEHSPERQSKDSCDPCKENEKCIINNEQCNTIKSGVVEDAEIDEGDASVSESKVLTENKVIEIVHPHVFITEVLANPKGKDDEEWIEIGNFGSGMVQIGGWILDEGNSKEEFMIPDGTILEPGQHVAFPKSVSQLPLGNKGERLKLYSGSFLIDTWAYSETAEDISFGRLPTGGSGSTKQFGAMCAATPGAPNTLDPPAISINVQSGELRREKSVSVNLQAHSQSGSLTSATCSWDYGDGFVSSSCNPPSHRFTEVGTYTVQLTVSTFCGQEIHKELEVVVAPTPNPSPPSTSSGQAGGGESSRATLASSYSIDTNERDPEVIEEDEEACELSPYAHLIRISEFLPNPYGPEAEGEWIELYNPFPADIQLCGLWLDDEKEGSKPYHLSVYTIQAESYLLIPRSESKIALNNNEDVVRLLALRGASSDGSRQSFADISSFLSMTDEIQEVSFQKAPEGETMAFRSDGLYVWTIFDTPGVENAFRTAERRYPTDTVVVSAALPNPVGKDIEGEWIELTNVGDTSIALTGWQLDNRLGSSKPFALDGVELSPGQVRRFSILDTKITLANKRDTARLLDPDGYVVSILGWTEAVDGRIYHPPVFSDERFAATVVDVVDGDTVDIAFTDLSVIEHLPDSLKRRWRHRVEQGLPFIRVRLIGIDTPETVHPTKAIQEFGNEASAFTKHHLLNQQVQIEFDRELWDKYNRLLAYVYLDSGQSIQEMLLKHGYAYAYTRFPFLRTEEYRSYEDEARLAKLGLWSDGEVKIALDELEELIEEEKKLQEEGLTITVNPPPGLVASGTLITFTPSVPADLYVSVHSGAYVPFSGNLTIQSDIQMRVYGERILQDSNAGSGQLLALRTASGSHAVSGLQEQEARVRSDVLDLFYILEKESYEIEVVISEIYSNPLLEKEKRSEREQEEIRVERDSCNDALCMRVMERRLKRMERRYKNILTDSLKPHRPYASPIFYDEWIELYNPTDHNVSLVGWTLDDVLEDGSKPYILGPEAIVASGSYLLLSRQQSSIALNNDGDEVWLIAPDGETSIGVTIPGLKRGDGYALTSQNEQIYCTTNVATPSKKNQCIAFKEGSNARDRDKDFISDDIEQWREGTNTYHPDTDGDGLLDGFEVDIGFDPLQPDILDKRIKKLYRDFVLKKVKPTIKMYKTKGLTIRGKAYPLSAATLSIPGLAWSDSIPLNADGSWQVNVPLSVPAGQYTVDITLTDNVGQRVYISKAAIVVVEHDYKPKKVKKSRLASKTLRKFSPLKPLNVRYKHLLSLAELPSNHAPAFALSLQKLSTKKRIIDSKFSSVHSSKYWLDAAVLLLMCVAIGGLILQCRMQNSE